jgi:isoleucyl-tRNA synthetase
MEQKYREYKGLNLSQAADDIRKYWSDNNTFANSMKIREGNKPFIFFEGPPSANGKPGIHHVMARTIKDIFCRYKTLKGFEVKRKAGWDTHGLPVEISVEKTLGITKEDIGKSISVEEYNQACRREVMKYKDLWDDLTREMGYWVDLDDPYITFDNKYIETVWYLLSELYKKGLMYKGYTVQPYSPAAGTGLSTHELNQPGCYRDVKDTTVVAQFKVVRDEKSAFLFADTELPVYFLAWTTTPWTLPSNTALAVGPGINYVKVRTFNAYTGEPMMVVLAKDLLAAHFPAKNAEIAFEDYKTGDKKVPFEVIQEFKGPDLVGMRYEQLMPWVKPEGDAFRVISGDYVTTEDGTGIVHIAPTFGADDDRVAKASNIAPLILRDKTGSIRPMVDLRGRFYMIEELDEEFVKKHINEELYGEYAGRFVKNEYDESLSDKDATLDIDLSVMLKKQNLAFKVEKHVHNYPHCWRTDKPILYYPLDSWFIRTTEYKKRMIELNNTINWKPEATGRGRFGNWLENLVDWNLSRSRFWGVPLPIWTSNDRSEQKCVGSAEQLKKEIEKAVDAGIMDNNPLEGFEPGNFTKDNYETFDLHRPYADNIVLVSDSGKALYREPDLIDVWFDSGSMPYAQFHYPFENKDMENYFPADFIAEGVDQTRGWFFTLHAIATMVFDSVAYKTCVSNGLVLDKEGNKMSKRLGNAVDPFETISKYGPDATRWYMITNSQPWDNLKFDLSGVAEVQRKFFGTLYNTYSFFAIYANIDGFKYAEKDIPFNERPELDRWILSELNTLIKAVDESYEQFEPTRAGRAIALFVNDHLSNWFVRLSRRRFWKGDYSSDKISAYQTLYQCLSAVAQISSPIAPFFMDRLFQDLNAVSGKENVNSVHLSDMPVADESCIDKALEERMQLAQKITSLVLSLRKKNNIRVRQPLQKIMIPTQSEHFTAQVDKIRDIVLSELNVKELEVIDEGSSILVKTIKPNFKALGPKYGKFMKQLAPAIKAMKDDEVNSLEQKGSHTINLDGQEFVIEITDVEIITEDIPGWVVANEGRLTVALDVNINEELRNEGLARDLVNRIQSLRKEKDFEVTDRIVLFVQKNEEIMKAIDSNNQYICSETLTDKLELVDAFSNGDAEDAELADGLIVKIKIEKK